MNTTTHLARHMLGFHPNKDAARLCLYHFLIHHCEPETPLTPQLFENFCRLALVHEHWQTNSLVLSQELQFILQHYNETYMLNWSMTDFVFPDHWQVVAIKNKVEGIHIFEKWAEQNQPDGQSRIFYTKDNNYIVLTQSAKGDVTVIHASPLMLIRKGELKPLTMDIRLHYDQNLDLRSDTAHYLKVENNTYARFRTQGRDIKGMIIRGYVFQNQKEVQGRINEFPNLYYPLKKVEQYYIDRKSDPDYIELVNVLEKATELFRLNHPEARSFGQAAFERGESALSNIFINDNVVQVLVNQLQDELT